jgi:hypothetical protein
MNKIKCTGCGLVNLASEYDCRRCGQDLGTRFMNSSQRIGPREAAKSSSWLTTILFLAVIGGAAYYLFSGVEKSYDNVKTNRPGAQANRPADTLGTRGEFEQRQKQNYKSAIQNSQGLAESQRHTEESNKLMQSLQK